MEQFTNQMIKEAAIDLYKRKTEGYFKQALDEYETYIRLTYSVQLKKNDMPKKTWGKLKDMEQNALEKYIYCEYYNRVCYDFSRQLMSEYLSDCQFDIFDDTQNEYIRCMRN